MYVNRRTCMCTENKITTTMVSVKYIVFLSLITLLLTPASSQSTGNITAIYAFGDSILDSGNNNALPTLCRSDHPPYGINFPEKVASGRFSDGLLPADFLICHLGKKELLPAYMDPVVTDEELLTGASFASSCSGLDDMTAARSGVLSMTTQFQQFQQAFERMQKIVGLNETGRIVKNAVFMVSGGSSDFLNIFYMQLSSITALSGYYDLLLGNLEVLVKRLHSVGAAKFAVIGLPPVGCLPAQATAYSMSPGGQRNKRECFAEHNVDARAYNAKLQSLISKWQATLPGSKVVYVDIYNPIMSMIKKPAAFGFEKPLEGCCGSGSIESGPLCNAGSVTCPDPSKLLFWDGVHPTQAAYKILAKQFQDKVLPSLV